MATALTQRYHDIALAATSAIESARPPIEIPPGPDPYERLCTRFRFPFPPREKQLLNFRAYAARRVVGIWDKPGTGKTFTATMHMCHRMIEPTHRAVQWIILVPPTVIPNWTRWLRSVQFFDQGAWRALTAAEYIGPNRKRTDLKAFDFIVTSYETFKRDYQHLTTGWLARIGGDSPHPGEVGRPGLLCDEAHKIKNVGSDNHRFAHTLYTHADAWVVLASGTPVTSPPDIYAYSRMKSPGAYRNLRDFEMTHAGPADEYGRVSEWLNLQHASNVLMEGATMTRRDEMVADMPPCTFQLVEYDLDPQHYRLYERLAQDRMLEIESTGEEITALSASALRAKFQQLVINWSHFAGDSTKVARGVELVEEVLDELGSSKLIVVAHYRMSVKALTEKLRGYGVVAVFGDLSYAAKQRSIDTFINDPGCRVMVLHPEAGGVGVDGLQHVCSDMIFLECPTVPRQFEQAFGRIDRTGQREPVVVRIAVARKTLQAAMFARLLDNDALVAALEDAPKTLRGELFGF